MSPEQPKQRRTRGTTVHLENVAIMTATETRIFAGKQQEFQFSACKQKIIIQPHD